MLRAYDGRMILHDREASDEKIETLGTGYASDISKESLFTQTSYGKVNCG